MIKHHSHKKQYILVKDILLYSKKITNQQVTIIHDQEIENYLHILKHKNFGRQLYIHLVPRAVKSFLEIRRDNLILKKHDPRKQDKSSELGKNWPRDSSSTRNKVQMKTIYLVNEESATTLAVIINSSMLL